jgi:chitodextrinase
VYAACSRVTYAGSVWVAQWWTKGETPGANPYDACAQLGDVVVTPGGTFRSWTPSWINSGGETVAYGGHLWKAKWWTRNQTPDAPNGPWRDL